MTVPNRFIFDLVWGQPTYGCCFDVPRRKSTAQLQEAVDSTRRRVADVAEKWRDARDFKCDRPLVDAVDEYRDALAEAHDGGAKG